MACQKRAWGREIAPHARTCAQLADLQVRAERAGFGAALDKMVCADCDFGPTSADNLRWHCTLTQHRRWPENDLLMYGEPEA